MKTAEVKQLVHTVLATLPRPFTVDVVDDVFHAIEREPYLLERYQELCIGLQKNVVHQWIGYWTAAALGTTGEKQRPSKKNHLAGSYSLLETNRTADEVATLIRDLNSGATPFAAAGAVDPDVPDRQRLADELAIAQDPDLPPTEKLAMINARRGQGLFRQRVLGIERSCRLTGVDDPAHLRASHIQPWSQSNNQDRLDGNNGLMLAPHIDHLFDRAHISFNDDGTLLVSNAAIRTLLKTWGIDVDTPAMAPRPFNAGQRGFLAWHRAAFREQQENMAA